MWPRWYHILSPLKDVSRNPKYRKILWNEALEDSFRELNCRVSDETLLRYPDLTTTFMVHTDDSDKKVGAIISHNNKPIENLSIILINTQYNYTTTDKELLAIVECLKQFCGILFGYEINVF